MPPLPRCGHQFDPHPSSEKQPEKVIICTRAAGHTGLHRSPSTNGGNVEWPHGVTLELTDNERVIFERHYRGRLVKLVNDASAALEMNTHDMRLEMARWLKAGS